MSIISDIESGNTENAKNKLLEAHYKALEQENKIDFTRINNDTNGNPRYVCHFLTFQTKDEMLGIEPFSYELALKRARKLGGRKFHNKQYGGGIVFQSYNIADTEKEIKELVANIK